MISLSNTTETLNIDLRLASSLDVVITYADHTSTAFTANGQSTNITATGNTTILAAPAAGTFREVKFLSIKNKDIASTQFILLKDVSGTQSYIGHLTTLKAGESLHYIAPRQWIYYDWNGRPRKQGVLRLTQQYEGQCQELARKTYGSGTTRTLVSGTSYASYVGRAPKTSVRMMVKHRITTASATITWGEYAIATGIPSFANNATLTVLGYNGANNPITLAAPGATTTNGEYLTTIDCAPGYQINEGDDVWIVIGSNATTPPTLRVTTSADSTLHTGTTQWAVTQPSANIGVPVAYTVDGAANVPFVLSVTYF